MAVNKEEIRKRVIEALKQVYDPEIPINVWDLGLIYGVNVTDDGVVNIKMTLTAPGCPLANMIAYRVYLAVQSVEGVKDVNVDVVFDPPWDPTKMTPEGRRKFKELMGYDIVETYESSRRGGS